MESGDAYIPISVRLLNNSIFIRTPNSAEYCLVQGKNSLSIVIDQLWSYLCEICLALRT